MMNTIGTKGDRNTDVPQVRGAPTLKDAAMVQEVAHVAAQPRDGGSRPTSPLQVPVTLGPKDLVVRPISHGVARLLCENHHYLGTYPGGSELSFGASATSSWGCWCLATDRPTFAAYFVMPNPKR